MAPEGSSSAATASAMEAEAARAMTGFWGRLSPGEQVAFAGAFVVLVVGEFLLSNLLSIGGVSLAVEVAAADVLLLIWARAARPSMVWPAPFPVLLAFAAVVVAVPTLSDVIADIAQLGTLFGDAGRLAAWVIDSVAGLAVGVGAWMVWREDAR